VANALQDQYPEEINNNIVEKDAKIREVQQRVNNISAKPRNMPM
jgi:hypothetical protein